MEVVGGKSSKDKKSDKDDKRPNPCLGLFWSADPNLLREPSQANLAKQLVHLLSQLLHLLKTKGGEFVLE